MNQLHLLADLVRGLVSISAATFRTPPSPRFQWLGIHYTHSLPAGFKSWNEYVTVKDGMTAWLWPRNRHDNSCKTLSKNGMYTQRRKYSWGLSAGILAVIYFKNFSIGLHTSKPATDPMCIKRWPIDNTTLTWTLTCFIQFIVWNNIFYCFFSVVQMIIVTTRRVFTMFNFTVCV